MRCESTKWGWRRYETKTLCNDRSVVEESMKKMEETIEQTRVQTVALNLRTFHFMSERFSSFCRTLVR